MYKVITSGRTFQTFTRKDEAVECAKYCFAAGFDNVFVAYGNGNPVPKTPRYEMTEKRYLGGVEMISLITVAKPYKVMQKFKADTIVVIADKNNIDPVFYREFWLGEIMTGRYSSTEYDFDF